MIQPHDWVDDRVHIPGCALPVRRHQLTISCMVHSAAVALLLLSCRRGRAQRHRAARTHARTRCSALEGGERTSELCKVELACLCEAWPVVCSVFLTLHFMLFLSWFSSRLTVPPCCRGAL